MDYTTHFLLHTLSPRTPKSNLTKNTISINKNALLRSQTHFEAKDEHFYQQTRFKNKKKNGLAILTRLKRSSENDFKTKLLD